MTRRRKVLTVCAALVLIVGGFVGTARLAAQTLGFGPWFVAVNPPTAAQFTLRVNTAVTPQRVELGMESTELSTAFLTPLAVNGIRLAGNFAGAAPTVQAIPSTGGDTNIGLQLLGTGTGSVFLTRPTQGDGGTTFRNYLFGTCTLTAPSGLTPATGNQARVDAPSTCAAAGVGVNANVIVQSIGTLENFLVLKGATPLSPGTIQLTWACLTSGTACPATGPQRYFWFAWNP